MISLALFLVTLAVSPEQLLQEAHQALDASDWQNAQKKLDQAQSLDPENVDVLYAAALLKGRLGDYHGATLLLSRLLELDPFNDDARYELAYISWQARDLNGARGVVGDLLDRQPGYAPALELRQTIESGGEPSGESAWHPQGRASLGVGYDNNWSMFGTAVPNATRLSGAIASADVAAGLAYATAQRPFSFLARLYTAQALQDREDLKVLSPTFLELSAIGRKQFSFAEGAADLRFAEFFSDSFSIHRQRMVSPTLWLSRQLSAKHRLRLAGGVEYRVPYVLPDARTNLTSKLSLRDQFNAGRLALTADLSARTNSALGSTAFSPNLPNDFRSAGFNEIALNLYGEYQTPLKLAAFGLAQGAGRKFENGPRESTYIAQVGLRYPMEFLELHTEYTYSRNLSSTLRSYQRHEVFMGVRAWLQ